MSDNEIESKPSTTLPAELPQDEAKNRRLSTRSIDSLFAKFAALYGAKLADQWTGLDLAAVKATWSDALSELDRSEIVSGLQQLVRSGKPFPPTLPEFYGYCRPKIEVPPVTDHVGLDRLSRQLGIGAGRNDSYFDLRQRLIEAVSSSAQRPRLSA